MICDDEADLLAVYAAAPKKAIQAAAVNSGKAWLEKHMECTLNDNKIDLMLLDTGLATARAMALPARYAIWTAQR
jgi:hypothetical protein